MKPGDSEVRFEKDGYLFGNKYPAQPYHVGQGQDPIRIRLDMTRLASLSGRILDPGGNPTSQAEVRIPTHGQVPVAADGTFTIKDLEPGSYTLAAIPKATRVPEGSRAPVPTYTPEPIVIRGDADASGVEIRLQTAEVYRISGVVLDARDVSGEDGSFEFPVVRSGEWQLLAASRGPIDSRNFADGVRSGAIDLVVGNRNVENLQIRLAAPSTVTGTVDWGDLPKQRVGILLNSGGNGMFFGVPPSLNPNGTVTLRAAPTIRSIILPSAGPGYYPVSLLLGGQEVLGKPVDLFPGATFRVAYRAAAGSMHGTVEKGSGATVLLIPASVQTIGFGRMVTCKADGTFDMSGIPPGDYYAAAFGQVQQTPSADAASIFLATIGAVGTHVSVGQTAASVQLKLNPSLE
jgi:hypothetical protein